MAFNPKIQYSPHLSVEDNLKAIVNWLNFSLREITVGRVLQTKEEVQHLSDDAAVMQDQLQQADETAIDLYEASIAQEEINAAQDEALIEIYEMMEG